MKIVLLAALLIKHCGLRRTPDAAPGLFCNLTNSTSRAREKLGWPDRRGWPRAD